MLHTLYSLLISVVLVGAALAAFGPWGGSAAAVVLVCAVGIIRHSLRPWRTGTIVGCVLLIGLIGLLGVFGLLGQRGAAFSEPLENARCIQCQYKLKRISWALRYYHEYYGHYPPAYIKGPDGKPWHSWRMLIVPWFCMEHIYRQYRFDEPWDGPNNRKLDGACASIYRCPCHGQYPNTNYLAVVGPQAAWLGDKERKATDFSDAGATIQLVEVADSGISWMEPRDITLEDALEAKDSKGHPSILSSHGGNTSNVAMADGSVHALPETLPTDALRSLLTIDADKTGILEAAEKARSEIASSRWRTFLMQLAILIGATFVLLLRPNPRWKKPPLSAEPPVPAVG